MSGHIKKIPKFFFYFDKACVTDDPVETPGYQKMPPQKEVSAPVGSKAGMLTTVHA